MTINKLVTDRALYPATLNEHFVRAYVARGTGLDPKLVIPAERNAPIPQDELFASLLLISDDATDNPTALELSHEGKFYRAYTQVRRATYSLQFYNKRAVETAAAFAQWVSTDTGMQCQRAMPDSPPAGEDPAWPDSTTMRVDMPLSFRRVSAVTDDAWEERAVIDMPCLYGVCWLQDAATIDIAQIEMSIGGSVRKLGIEIGRDVGDRC